MMDERLDLIGEILVLVGHGHGHLQREFEAPGIFWESTQHPLATNGM